MIVHNEDTIARETVDRNKQEQINAFTSGLSSSNRATRENTIQILTDTAANNPAVNVVNGAPVFAEFRTADEAQQEITKIHAQINANPGSYTSNISPEQLVTERFEQENAEIQKNIDIFNNSIANASGAQANRTFGEQKRELERGLTELGATSAQKNAARQDFTTSNASLNELSEEGKGIVTGQQQELEAQHQAAVVREQTILNEAIESNPAKFTLNDEGKAFKFRDVTDKAREQYASDSWLGGAGGDALTGLIRDIKFKGITADGENGNGIGKRGSFEVEPWMYIQAMDLAGQTSADAVGNPTVSKSEFRRILGQLASDTRYKEGKVTLANAYKRFNKFTLDGNISKLRAQAQVSKNQKDIEQVRSSATNRFINTLRQER